MLGRGMKLIFSIVVILFSVNTKSDVRLKDIGIIGLVSHDLFAWDRKNEINTENGRLDLSTIFDYDNGSRWAKGGNPKNGENSPVWTITKNLVNFQKNQLRQGKSFEAARKATVIEFHKIVIESFKRLSGQEMPEFTINKMVTNVEQASLRAMHDILPGRVKTFRHILFPIKSFKLTDFLFLKFYLNEKELNQKISYFDGDYDYEYKNIKIPFTSKVINLKEVDRKFIEKYSNYKQVEMLDELRQVGAGEIHIQDVFFINHIREMFQKGFCSTGNKWMPDSIPCE